MKAAAALTAVLAAVVLLSAAPKAHAQSNPYPTGGGNASPVLPGVESLAAPDASPLRSFASALLGYSAFPAAGAAWVQQAASRPARLSQASRPGRTNPARRVVLPRTSR
jgi:hypothetical protein